jgi:hypothetical protein
MELSLVSYCLCIFSHLSKKKVWSVILLIESENKNDITSTYFDQLEVKVTGNINAIMGKRS